MVKDLHISEKHLAVLVIALGGSNRTVILDEPFSGLSYDHQLKLVKIIRQKHDCTVIVTAKSKADIELLQPHSVLTIATSTNQYTEPDQNGYLLALRLKPSVPLQSNEDDQGQNQGLLSARGSKHGSVSDFASLQGDDLHSFITCNFQIFEKLRGKKRSLINSAITKLMRKAKMSPEVCEEIAEMVHEDLEMSITRDELAVKCELIISLYTVIEALCKRFGEVHLEQRYDDYAVLRVIHNEACRLKGLDDSFSD